MKYIVMRRKIGTMHQELPFIFAEHCVHSDMVKAVQTMEGWEKSKPVAAGDYDVHTQECSGKSTSTKLKSRLKDKWLIEMHQYTGGFK